MTFGICTFCMNSLQQSREAEYPASQTGRIMVGLALRWLLSHRAVRGLSQDQEEKDLKSNT